MKVLLTGGAGYVGSVVARFLLAQGHAVRVLDSLLYGGESLLGLYPDDQFRFIRGDIRAADVVREALTGIDAVVHLAAIVGDPACTRQPELAKAVNLDASLQLFALSRAAEVQRLVFASTCSNYGRMTDPTAYLTEESALQPVSLYAETKVAVERALLAADAPGPPVTTVLRFATVFGLSPRMRFDLTVNEFTMELLTKRTVTIFGEQFWRPYVHVRDAARAVGAVLEAPPELVGGQAFNVGDTTQNFQKGQLVDLVRRQVPAGVEVERIHKTEDPRDYRVSFDKIHRTLGFEITKTVDDGIREILGVLSAGVIADAVSPRYRNS